MSCIAVVNKSFHLWPTLFGVMRVKPFKVCKCKLISTVICVVSLSSVHKSKLMVMFRCFVFFLCFALLLVSVVM